MTMPPVPDPTGAPDVEVHADGAALATRVAARLLERMATAQAAGEVPQVVLTGGTVADVLHRELAVQTGTSPVDWSRVEVWWGDERFVAADDPDRNAAQARASLLDHVPVTPERVHEVPAADGRTLEEAAAAYEEDLRGHGNALFDVVMLGLGPDGHVASLFPGRPSLEVTGAVTVAEPDSPKPPPERVSLTFEALNRARAVWFLVSGEGKAEAVARAMAGEDLHDVPATGVRGLEETVWFLDEAAASRLA